MRRPAYIAMLAVSLAVLFAFATAPAVAQMTPGSMMEQSEKVLQHKGQMGGEAEAEFGGEAKAGASQEKRTEGEGKAEMKAEPKAEMKTEGKAAVSTEPKAQMKGEGKADVKTEPKASIPGAAKTGEEMKAGMKGESKGEVRGKPEAGIIGTMPRADISARAQGRTAIVLSVDMPENCLRVRSGPSASSDIITCVPQGQTLNLVGVFSEDGRWAQLDNNGWVFFSQLRTDVRPSGAEWEKAAAEGKKSKGKKMYRGHKFRHYYGCFYPGYYYYGYPGYYHYGYRSHSSGFPGFFGRPGGLWY
ncbi:MAG: SH3 domain-containing protein [Thermodesulfobacteriota bacterium]